MVELTLRLVIGSVNLKNLEVKDATMPEKARRWRGVAGGGWMEGSGWRGMDGRGKRFGIASRGLQEMSRTAWLINTVTACFWPRQAVS